MALTDALSTGDDSLESQRRRQLIDAAIACVAEAGVAHTTMRMIAERAGVTTGMLLYYYRSKRELIAAAIADVNEEFSVRINRLTDGTYGLRRLEALLGAFLGDPAEGVSRNFSVQYRAASLSDPDLRRTALEQVNVAREKVGLSIRSGQAQGEFRPDVDDMLAADLVFVLMQGLVMEEVLSPEVITRERALAIARMALGFLIAPASSVAGPSPQPQARPRPAADAIVRAQPTPAAIEAALFADPQLDAATARELAAAFVALYSLVTARG